MPKKEKYGAQPPIELLRQWMDHEGWYDRKTMQFKKVVDIQFVCAMGPPGGGRNPLTSRFVRHFNFLSFTHLEKPSLKVIFTTILGTFLKPFPADVRRLTEPLVDAAIDVSFYDLRVTVIFLDELACVQHNINRAVAHAIQESLHIQLARLVESVPGHTLRGPVTIKPGRCSPGEAVGARVHARV